MQVATRCQLWAIMFVISQSHAVCMVREMLYIVSKYVHMSIHVSVHENELGEENEHVLDHMYVRSLQLFYVMSLVCLAV